MAKVIHCTPEETLSKRAWKQGDLLVLTDEARARSTLNFNRAVIFINFESDGMFKGVEINNGDLCDTWATECFVLAPEGHTVTVSN